MSNAPRATDLDPYAPAQMARLAENVGVKKAALSTVELLVLAALAGAFIAFGAMLYTVVVTGSTLGFGPTRLLGGVAFSVGLVLVVVGGAELFTGNNLIVMAWAHRKVGAGALLRNWALAYAGNAAGAAFTLGLVVLTGTLGLGEGAVAGTAAAIARGKLDLGPVEAFARGVLCNALVCLAVWLCFASRRVSGKILAIVFPVSAFVALGFEHSVANMYLIPAGMVANGDAIDVAALAANLFPVTLGNILGGGVFVAAVYWLVYLRGHD